MQYGKYRFVCEFQNTAVLPQYKGSTFRGVFGRALKQVVCALKRQECAECLLKKRCLYALVFETPIAMKVKPGARVSEPPHPFIIEPPQNAKTEYKKGEEINFILSLFGKVNSRFPYFVYAFNQMGKTGLGRLINGRRGSFVLKKIFYGSMEIYSDKDKTLTLPETIDELAIDDKLSDAKGETCISICLETPFRLKYEKKLARQLPFHVLTRAMLRRISIILEHYDEGEPDLDYKGLIDRAAHIRIVDSTIRWFDWERYSFRKKQRMKMGGMVGTVTYEGAIDEFLPLLDFCSKVNLGKNTSFGLGKIKIQKT